MPWGRPPPHAIESRARGALASFLDMSAVLGVRAFLPDGRFEGAGKSSTLVLAGMGALHDLLRRLDPDPYKRGKQFEHICKWFLENDPTYQPLLRKVWLWDDWPGRRGIDAGIDLVAEDHDGRLWAIQAKAYDAAYSVSKRDVDTFIAESSRSKFSHRFLIATTDKRHYLATRLMDDLDIPFLGLTQLAEADDYLDWPATPATLRPTKPAKPKKPHDHQQVAMSEVVKGFKTADRGQLIMACGTGKTLTAWFIKERLAAERTLVLVPSLSLLKQTMREWRTANPRKPFLALPVCSDETVGSFGEDAAVAHTSDLGVPVTTDPAEIAAFLRKRSGSRVVFSTYQSSPRIAAAFALGRVPQFDLVIADEAHRVAGPVSSDFGTVLDPNGIRATRRLFMTATPRYFTGRRLRQKEGLEYEVASMDDPVRFGEVFHRLSFGEAIERQLLTDYQVAIIGVDNATYRSWAERGALVTLDGKKITDARALAGHIGLAKAMKKFNLRRVISFHGRVKAAKEFSVSMPAVLDWMPRRQRPTGCIWSDYASGEMSAGDRAVLIQHLKRLDDGERGLLANARCLAEGVDVPALDGVAFIDPRRAEVDIVQAVGRAIRLAPDKSLGTVVIPVFIGSEENPETVLNDSAFKPVWDVIKALRAHDEELGRQLDEVRRELGHRRRGHLKMPPKIRYDLPATISPEFASAFDVRLVEQTTESWEFWIGLVERYVQENGNALIPAKKPFYGHRLGAWVNEQRSRYAEGTLPAERIRRLSAIEGWTWAARDAVWEQGFTSLTKYIAQEGNSLVPSSYIARDGFKLGQWVSVQRTRYGQGTLPEQRRERLGGLPGWQWDFKDHLWEEGFRHLQEYLECHGNTLMPQRYESDDGYKLGSWVNTQRVAYRKGSLPIDRQRRLLALFGWVWSAKEASWEDGVARLIRYVEAHGHVEIPSNYVDSDGFRLGSWVVTQRAARRAGKLKPERERKLLTVPGWQWDTRSKNWDEGYEHLLRYVEKFKDAAVEHGYVDDEGYGLGEWARRQRRNRNTLDVDRVAKLDQLPGWTWAISYSDQWEESFRQLLRYVELHGDARVPSTYVVDGFPLGAWVARQRIKRRRGTLDPECERLLREVPSWVWEVRADDWEDMFRRLQHFVECNGHARVPQHYTVDGHKLGRWVSRQRQSRRKGTLDDSQERRLKGLPGWTWTAVSS